MGCLYKIKELQTADEYYEFVRNLQSLKSFPKTLEDKSGIYIVRKISTGCRKMKLGLGILKEQNNFNISCWSINENNKFIRSRTPEGETINFLDHEISIMGIVTLMREFFTSVGAQGVNAFWITVFPMQIDLARKILNKPDWVPSVFYRGGNTGIISTSSFNPSDANVNIDIARVDGVGNGSGFGVTKNISFTRNAAVPVKQQDITFSLQIPQNTFNDRKITPLPLNSYYVFQVQMIGNQRNIWPLTNSNGKTVFDLDLPVLTGEV